DFPELEDENNKAGESPLSYVGRDMVALLKLERKYAGLLERYNKLLNILVKVANTNELETLRKEILRFLENNLD
ncbi:MAG: hypothetical protein AAFQ01_02165, partial [Bacteroidota bacterium]